MSDNFFNAIKEASDKYAEAAFGDASFPDAAFLVEHGAEKDKSGKTLSKYRHLPHHNKNVQSPTENSSVDLPHLRNALARVSQVKPVKEDGAGFVSRAQAHLQRHAKALLKSNKAEICAEAQLICKEFNISLEDESNANHIKIIKNGADDKPYCMVQDGKKLMCHATLKEAQDHMNKMMNKTEKIIKKSVY